VYKEDHDKITTKGPFYTPFSLSHCSLGALI